MNNKGFSLVELVTIVTIIGILLSISTLGFNSWQRKYNVEKQTKEMFADMNDLRLRAVQTKKQHRLVLQADSYLFKRYSSEGEDPDTSTSAPVFKQYLKYPIAKKDGSCVAGEQLNIDSRGYADTELVLKVGTNANDAALNCLIISTARTNMGKMENEECKAK
jgi:type II secretory pathway pseudopilin PulG